MALHGLKGSQSIAKSDEKVVFQGYNLPSRVPTQNLFKSARTPREIRHHNILIHIIIIFQLSINPSVTDSHFVVYEPKKMLSIVLVVGLLLSSVVSARPGPPPAPQVALFNLPAAVTPPGKTTLQLVYQGYGTAP